MFSNSFLIRTMARIANNGRKQNKWEPPPKDIYVLRTPNKHPMRMPIDFKKPRTPGRQPAADRYTIYGICTLEFLLYQFKISSQKFYTLIQTPFEYLSFFRGFVMRFQNWGCKNRPFLRLIISKDRLALTRKGKYEVLQLN